MRFLAMVLVPAFIPFAWADEKDGPAIRPLEMKDVKLIYVGSAPAPTEVQSAAELAKCKSFADDASREAVKKQVDFAKEKLVVFAWSGSGGDRLTSKWTTGGKKPVATFAYRAGFTDDLRRHAQVYAVPREAAVQMAK